MFLSLELQAFPATPVGDFIGSLFLFRCKYIKKCKSKGTITRYFLRKYLCKRLHWHSCQKVRM